MLLHTLHMKTLCDNPHVHVISLLSTSNMDLLIKTQSVDSRQHALYEEVSSTPLL